jgi:hypothetical protein
MKLNVLQQTFFSKQIKCYDPKDDAFNDLESAD